MVQTDSALAADLSRPYYQSDFAPTEFAARRAAIAETIGTDATAVLRGNGPTGAFDLFRQTNDFYYLSGVEVPQAYLSIDGRSGETTIYLPPHDPRHEESEGKQFHADAPEMVTAMTGIENVRPWLGLAEDIKSAKIIFTPHSPGEGSQACRDVLLHAHKQIMADPWDKEPTAEERFIEKMRGENPDIITQDLSPILDRLRLVKSVREIEMMRWAGHLTALATAEAMRCTKPGLTEYHLAAAADYVYHLNGVRSAGYRPIIGCGANIWNAHYYRNNCPLQNDELVIMDYAPDCGYYTSDIGRIWPVNGQYSDLQRELYGFIVKYHKALLSVIRPGVSPAQVMSEAASIMRLVVETMLWSKPIYRDAAYKTLTFQGHLSHPVGMAVHDVGNYFSSELTPGTVFALDPQMWIPEEQLYIRVEDTVVVTDIGVENLTSLAPLELDDVEALMQEPGVLDVRPLFANNFLLR